MEKSFIISLSAFMLLPACKSSQNKTMLKSNTQDFRAEGWLDDNTTMTVSRLCASMARTYTRRLMQW